VPEIHAADKERLTNLYSTGVMLLAELCRDKEIKIIRFVRDTNKGDSSAPRAKTKAR